MILKISKGKICTVEHHWKYEFDLNVCTRCSRYNVCKNFIDEARASRKYREVVKVKPLNHYKLLSDEDIEKMVESYKGKEYLDVVAEVLQRTTGSISWVYDIIEKLEVIQNEEVEAIKAFYGEKRVNQVMKYLVEVDR